LVADPKQPPGFSSAKLLHDDFVCVARRKHPSIGKRLTLEQYVTLGHILVAPSGSPGSLVDTTLARQGLRRHIAVRISSFLVAPILVCESDLITTAPSRLAKQFERAHPVKLLKPPLALQGFDLSMVWHTRNDHDAAHSYLRNVLREVSAKL
jgi:DNA-binding transcriptional LysR family regulator